MPKLIIRRERVIRNQVTPAPIKWTSLNFQKRSFWVGFNLGLALVQFLCSSGNRGGPSPVFQGSFSSSDDFMPGEAGGVTPLPRSSMRVWVHDVMLQGGLGDPTFPLQGYQTAPGSSLGRFDQQNCTRHSQPPVRWKEQLPKVCSQEADGAWWWLWSTCPPGKYFFHNSASIHQFYLMLGTSVSAQSVAPGTLRYLFWKQWLKCCFVHHCRSWPAIYINLLRTGVLSNTIGHKRKYSFCPCCQEELSVLNSWMTARRNGKRNCRIDLMVN